MKFGIEVMGASGKWIKFRIGSRQGPQASFDDRSKAEAYLASRSMSSQSYRVVEL